MPCGHSPVPVKPDVRLARATTIPPCWKGQTPWLAACAAAVIAVVGVSAFFHPRLQRVARVESHLSARLLLARYTYETAVGGQRKIILADGSSVFLNTNSRVDVAFSGKRRDVHLTRGEAYFEVVHDQARPFTVHANNYVVRDIGTAFDVHLSKMGLVEVGVTKGSVEVAPATGARVFGVPKHVKIIVAGHNIVLGQAVEQPKAVSSSDIRRKLAWREGELIYTGQPLGEVLADISRYSNIKIELADPALENLAVGGAFRTDQIEAIFAALENNFGVHAEWINPQYVRFTSAMRSRLPGIKSFRRGNRGPSLSLI